MSTSIRIIYILLISAVLLAGCQYSGNESNGLKNITPVGYKQGEANKNDPVNSAKEFVDSLHEVKKSRIIGAGKNIIVALELKHQYTLRTKSITKEIKKELENKIPKKKIEVTSDHKIYLEVDRLQQKVKNKSISEKKLKKEIKRLNTLMNDTA